MNLVEDRDLWKAHLQQKAALQEYARIRLRRQLARHGESPDTLAELGDILDPQTLTIGFARRMATYKRAALLFSDIERITRLITDADRPVQFIFAGKAHPADRPGQGVIQTIFEHSRSEALRGRIFILEDYDMRVGRHLVQGVDVWLNNPRRPLEASGTSGMKAAMNGVINVSILDGWWDEGFHGDNGWAIGGRDPEPRRGRPGLGRRPGPLPPAGGGDRAALVRPRRATACRRAGWTACARRQGTSLWDFSTTRMLAQYVEQMYLPAAGEVRPTEPVTPPTRGQWQRRVSGGAGPRSASQRVQVKARSKPSAE